MIRDDASGTAHPHALQVGRDLHQAAYHRRVDGVVVGMQAHVMVASQAERGTPSGAGRHRRQREHRGEVGLDPVGGAASEAAHVPGVGAGQPLAELGVEVIR